MMRIGIFGSFVETYGAGDMGWNDRQYSGADYSGGDLNARLARWFNASFPVGTYLDIQVRVNIWFAVLPLYIYVHSGDLWITARMTVIWFLSVLLHEFGHALGCRSVGGSADRILMWPLGGLAFVAPPRQPWADFVTTACGPLVNVIIAGGCFAALFVLSHGDAPVGFNPFDPWQYSAWSQGRIGWLLIDFFVVNYWLLLFNLCLVFYPFDGGRLVQVAIWKFTSYHRSMFLATRIGMVGSVVTGLIGIALTNLMLTFIAIFGFTTCYQQAQALKCDTDVTPWSGDSDAWRYGPTHRQPRRTWMTDWRDRRQLRRQARQEQVEAEIGRILQKVKDHGLHSLTRSEKKMLQRETDRLRQS